MTRSPSINPRASGEPNKYNDSIADDFDEIRQFLKEMSLLDSKCSGLITLLDNIEKNVEQIKRAIKARAADANKIVKDTDALLSKFHDSTILKVNSINKIDPIVVFERESHEVLAKVRKVSKAPPSSSRDAKDFKQYSNEITDMVESGINRFNRKHYDEAHSIFKKLKGNIVRRYETFFKLAQIPSSFKSTVTGEFKISVDRLVVACNLMIRKLKIPNAIYSLFDTLDAQSKKAEALAAANDGSSKVSSAKSASNSPQANGTSNPASGARNRRSSSYDSQTRNNSTAQNADNKPDSHKKVDLPPVNKNNYNREYANESNVRVSQYTSSTLRLPPSAIDPMSYISPKGSKSFGSHSLRLKNSNSVSVRVDLPPPGKYSQKDSSSTESRRTGNSQDLSRTKSTIDDNGSYQQRLIKEFRSNMRAVEPKLADYFSQIKQPGARNQFMKQFNVVKNNLNNDNLLNNSDILRRMIGSLSQLEDEFDRIRNYDSVSRRVVELLSRMTGLIATANQSKDKRTDNNTDVNDIHLYDSNSINEDGLKKLSHEELIQAFRTLHRDMRQNKKDHLHEIKEMNERSRENDAYVVRAAKKLRKINDQILQHLNPKDRSLNPVKELLSSQFSLIEDLLGDE